MHLSDSLLGTHSSLSDRLLGTSDSIDDTDPRELTSCCTYGWKLTEIATFILVYTDLVFLGLYTSPLGTSPSPIASPHCNRNPNPNIIVMLDLSLDCMTMTPPAY